MKPYVEPWTPPDEPVARRLRSNAQRQVEEDEVEEEEVGEEEKK